MSYIDIVELLEKSKPQKYHEVSVEEDLWEDYPVPFKTKVCLCISACVPETCPRYTEQCTHCGLWLEEDGFKNCETEEVYCVRCVRALETMPRSEAAEFFVNFAYGGYRKLFWGREPDKRDCDFDNPFCGSCAEHEHYLNGTQFMYGTHEEGSPEFCYNCNQKMCANHGDPECEVCKGEGDIEQNGMRVNCHWCCDEGEKQKPFNETVNNE